jgi:hypothetical protein
MRLAGYVLPQAVAPAQRVLRRLRHRHKLRTYLDNL